MKRCAECKENKDISWFHKHKLSKDGLRSICKICRSTSTKGYKPKSVILDGMKKCTLCSELKLLDEFPYRSDRVNGVRPACKVCENERNKRYTNTEGARKRARINTAKQKAKAPYRYKTSYRVQSAVASGKLKKSKCCELCGSEPSRIEGHHWSYLEEHWLDVVWLCKQCHSDIHNNKEVYILRRQNDVILHHIICGELK